MQQQINGTPSKPTTINNTISNINKVPPRGPQNTQQTTENIANAIAIRKK